MEEQVFRLDAGTERSVAVLRWVAAAAVLGATTWMAFLGPSPLCWLGILGSWLVVVGWFFAGRAARRRARNPDRHYLALRAGGLALADGGPEISVPWDQVIAVEIDEEKLLVRVTRVSDPVLLIEPRYGTPLDALREAIVRAWRAYTPGSEQGQDGHEAGG